MFSYVRTTDSSPGVSVGYADVTEDEFARVMRLITIVSTQTRLLALHAQEAALG
jgi:hypothetical protein